MPDTTPIAIDALKKIAAEEAATAVRSGMIVGLGHGSTAIHALRRIASRLHSGDLANVLGIPCSSEVEREALTLGIPLTTLREHPVVDITIDGADEVDERLNLIKGGGGALLREKIVAQASRREIIVVDESKLSSLLGTHFQLPVEVVPFGEIPVAAYLRQLGCTPTTRTRDGGNFVTDQGNIIIDCDFGPIKEPAKLATALDSRAGIVEHGLFIGLASEVIVASPDGIRHLRA